MERCSLLRARSGVRFSNCGVSPLGVLLPFWAAFFKIRDYSCLSWYESYS